MHPGDGRLQEKSFIYLNFRAQFLSAVSAIVCCCFEVLKLVRKLQEKKKNEKNYLRIFCEAREARQPYQVLTWAVAVDFGLRSYWCHGG